MSAVLKFLSRQLNIFYPPSIPRQTDINDNRCCHLMHKMRHFLLSVIIVLTILLGAAAVHYGHYLHALYRPLGVSDSTVFIYSEPKQVIQSLQVNIVMITYQPDYYIHKLAEEFVTLLQYDVYIVIDDNSVQWNATYCPISSTACIRYVQFENAHMLDSGWYGFCPACKSDITAYDKSMYLMFGDDWRDTMQQYNYTWFLEDDVVVPNVYILQQLTYQALLDNTDLMYPPVGNLHDGWYWWSGNWQNTPFYSTSIEAVHGMTCAMLYRPRSFVKAYWQFVSDFARPLSNNTLNNTNGLYNEWVFPTLAKLYNLTIDHNDALSTIKYREDVHESNLTVLTWMNEPQHGNWDPDYIVERSLADDWKLYHPLKSGFTSLQIRQYLADKLQPTI